MIKTGIYTLDDIRTQAKLCRKPLKTVSITLYDKILSEPNADELAERILLLFADERGAYKRTYAKRFEEFDQCVLVHLKNAFTNDKPLLFQDVGVSDGRTALDFFEKMSPLFPNLRYVASDYNPKVYVLERRKCKITISHTAKVLEILWLPFVFNTIKRESYKFYPLNYLIRLFIQFLVVSPLLRDYKRGKVQAKELMLFAPRVLELAKIDSRFILKQYNILEPYKEQVDVIRAMNILNPTYFSETEFVKVISNIHAGLKEGGFLITGSNEEAGTLVHGGIYQKVGNCFQKIEQSGKGSPVDKLILCKF